jgi:ferrous-iron efflux pump FieF
VPPVLPAEGAAPLEERAIRAAIACSLLGAGAKFTAGLLTGSMSLVSSAADSIGDLFVSIANLFVVRYGHRPADEDHNYGHAKIEGIGAMFEGGFVFASATFIVYETLARLARGERAHDPGIGLAVMAPVLAMTAGTVVYLRRVARRTGSLVLKADATHYLTDVWVNLGVIASLVLVRVTGRPVVDTVVSIAIALYMMISSRGVVRDGFDLLMDKSLEPEVVDRVAALLRESPSLDSYHDLRTRRGRVPAVDFHAVVGPDMTVRDLHALYEELRDRIRAVVGPTTRVSMHADPDAAPDSDDAED